MIVLLLVGINALLTPLLERLWESLREDNPQYYLPLQWWLSVPFTLFLFAFLSAVLSRFASLKEWRRTFLLLCLSKAILSGVTVVFLYLRMELGVLEAAGRATFFSLPCVLVHILLSVLAVMFLRDSLTEGAAEEVLTTPYFPGVELEQPPLIGEPGPTAAAIAAPEEKPAPATIALPVQKLLPSFPKRELAMTPEDIEELCPSVEIPLDVVLPQLREGRVEVDAGMVISRLPGEAFRRPSNEVAQQFPGGKMELPLKEVVRLVPEENFTLPQQELQPTVGEEVPEPFPELARVAARRPVEALLPKVEEAEEAEIAVEEPPRPEAPAEEGGVPRGALVLTEQDRHLLESTRHMIQLSMGSVLAQFPSGILRGRELSEGLVPAEVAAGAEARLPETLDAPLELILPQLAAGEVKIEAKYFLFQFPKGSLSMSEEEIICSLPAGQVELSLREIVPQLPEDALAFPDQELQPPVEDMPDPFREVEHVRPVGMGPVPAEGEVSVPEAAALGVSEGARPLVEAEVSPEPIVVPTPEEKPAVASYAEMLREENPLLLPVDVVVRLLPEGSFFVPAEELKRSVGGETVKLPRTVVMSQLEEGRVVVPVELLSLQFPRDLFRMSVAEMKSRLEEGLVEVPLEQLVWQVFREIAQLPHGQLLQPECEEISTLFHEIPQKPLPAEEERPRPEEAEAVAPAEEVPVGAEIGAGAGPTVERSREEKVIPFTQEAPAEGGEEVAGNLLQRLHGLGLADPVWVASGDYSAFVLASSNLDREVVGCGTMEIMLHMRGFCDDYSLGKPHKLVISCSGGALVCRELVRGEIARIIVLASRNRSGAGVMSLVPDRLEARLSELSALADRGLEGRDLDLDVKRMPFRPGGVPEEVCGNMMAVLTEVGMESYISGKTGYGQKLVAVWGGSFSLRGEPPAGEPLPEEDKPLREGVFDVELLSRFCLDAGLGTLESSLLVTEQVKVTLDRSSADGPAYLLCFFPGNYREGLVRAKAHKAAILLEK